MSVLSQRVLVPCPVNQADGHLSRYFREHGNRDGDISRLQLRAGGVEHSAIATFMKQRTSPDMISSYAVSWAPEGGGPYPMFTGTFKIENADDYNAFYLAIDGSYTPPFAEAGRAFDAMLGHRIANAVAANLLADIGDFIMGRFASVESDKARERAIAHVVE
ncbi:MAG: hypothetical protein NVSMB64_12430 [Candidatus Velthaea sp.]